MSFSVKFCHSVVKFEISSELPHFIFSRIKLFDQLYNSNYIAFFYCNHYHHDSYCDLDRRNSLFEGYFEGSTFVVRGILAILSVGYFFEGTIDKPWVFACLSTVGFSCTLWALWVLRTTS